jgi:hypothetical protein
MNNQILIDKQISELRDEYMKIFVSNVKDLVKENKNVEINDYEHLKPRQYYKQMIFNIVDDNLLNNFEVELEFVEDNYQRDIFEYYRINVSSIQGGKPKGRFIQILVKEKNSKKYIGIISLSSDLYALKERDELIGWSKEVKHRKLNHIMNITCCVGLRPNSYNLNIGKLLAMIPFCEEFQEYHKRKYGHYLAGILTTSIYGKSIQYSQLKELKFIGYTKGFGSQHISKELYQKGIQLLKNINYDMSKLQGSSPKIRRLRTICEILDIPQDLLKHNLKRGIYFGFTSPDGKDYLNEKILDFNPSFKSLNDVVKQWKEKYAIKRYNHLKIQNRLLKESDIDDQYNKMKNVKKIRKHRENKIKEIGKNKYNEIESKKALERYYKRKELKFINFELTDKIKNSLLQYDNLISKLTSNYLAGCFDAIGQFNKESNTIQFVSKYLPLLYLINHNYSGNILYADNSSENIKYYKLVIDTLETTNLIENIKNKIILNKFEDDKNLTIKEKHQLFNPEYITGYFDQNAEFKIQEVSEKIGDEKKINKYSCQIDFPDDMMVNMFHNKINETQKEDKIGKVILEKNRWKVESKRINNLLDFIRPYSICILREIDIIDKFLMTITSQGTNIKYNLEIHKLRKKYKNDLDNLYSNNIIFDNNDIENNNDEKNIILNTLELAKRKELTEAERKGKRNQKLREKINCDWCKIEISKNALYLHKKKFCKKKPKTKEEKKAEQICKGKEIIKCPKCKKEMTRNALNRHKRQYCH